MQQGTTCSREVASLPKTSSCKEKSDSVSSNLSSCSVSDLAQLTNQYRATGRIRRESRGQLGGGLGQSSLQVLTNYLVKETKDTMDVVRETKDTMEAEENKAKLKLTAKMGFYSPNQLTKGSDPYKRKKMLLEMKDFPRKSFVHSSWKIEAD